MNTVEVEITAGHWKIGTGAHSLLDEVEEARRVGKKVHSILKDNGVKTTYYNDNRNTNQTDNVNHLINYHNADYNGLVVSIHFNTTSGVVKNGIGTEVLYYKSGDKKLAADLSNAISKASGLKNRGAKYRDNVGIIRRTVEPAVLIEVCFINSKEDVKLYNDNFNEICNAIAEILAKRVGDKIDNKKPVNTSTSNKKPSPLPSDKQELYRVQSGAYDTKKEMEKAIDSGASLGIFSKKYVTKHKSGDKHYFITGTYKGKKSAQNAINKMKDYKILWIASIIK